MKIRSCAIVTLRVHSWSNSELQLMPLFTYTARDRNGQQRIDAIESATRESAILALRAQGLLPLKIEELKQRRSGGYQVIQPESPGLPFV